jgi:hypothetical protein
VLPAESQGIDAHLLGELIDGGFEGERAFDVARRAEGRKRARVGDHLV